jgi:hypothetical protein
MLSVPLAWFSIAQHEGLGMNTGSTFTPAALMTFTNLLAPALPHIIPLVLLTPATALSNLHLVLLHYFNRPST